MALASAASGMVFHACNSSVSFPGGSVDVTPGRVRVDVPGVEVDVDPLGVSVDAPFTDVDIGHPG